jgi:hypothetical protein
VGNLLQSVSPPSTLTASADARPFSLSIVPVLNDTEYSRAVYAAAMRDQAGAAASSIRIRGEFDHWSNDRGDLQQDQFFVIEGAEDLQQATAALEAFIAKLQVSVAPPDGATFGFEALETSARAWRTYLLSYRPEDGLNIQAIDHAVVAEDFSTGRPLVAITCTAQGRQRLGELSGSWVGRKAAIVVNGAVMTAPIFNSAITGGEASIAIGSHSQNPRDEATKLADAINATNPDLRPDMAAQPDDNIASRWLMLAILAVFAFGLTALAWIVVGRFNQYADIKSLAFGLPPSHAFSLRALPSLAITIAVAFILWWLAHEGALAIPGSEALMAQLRRSAPPNADLCQLSVLALGVTPMIAGFQLVEFVA